MSDTAPYYTILEKIDQSDYEVKEWEAEFLESLLKHRPYALSDRQRQAIRQMALQYLDDEVHLP